MFKQLWMQLRYWILDLLGKRKRTSVGKDEYKQRQEVVNLLVMEQYLQNYR